MHKLFLVTISLVLISCSENNETYESGESERTTNNLIESFNQSSSSRVFYDETEEYIIGNVEGVKINNGRVYLIDQDDTKVLVLSEQGNLIQQVGRSGRGPGEYMHPTSLDISNNELILLDESLGRITRYVYENDLSELTLKNSGSPDLNMTDMCISDGSVWVYARTEDNTIHQLSVDLQSVTRSFGSGYDADDLAKREVSGNGILACDGHFIYSGFVSDNKIRIYSKSDGSLYRQIEFKNINPIEISIINREGTQALARNYYPGEAYDDKGDFHDSLKNITVINDHLLVQYERFYANSDSDQHYIISLNIDLNDGSYTTSEELPLIYDHKNGTLISGANYPLPFVELHKISN